MDSDIALASVTPFSIEAEDNLDFTTDPTRIDFTMRMWTTAEDGVDFTLGAGSADTCFDWTTVPSGAQVFVGGNKVVHTPPFQLETLGPCGLGLSIDDVTVDEAAGNATFTVSLTGTPAGVVTVDYNTVDGTATAGSDYTPATGQLSFAISETSHTIVVPILQDNSSEGSSEDFQVLLSNPVNSLIVDGVGVGTITDDDISPCGAPSYAPGSERGIFIWKDCGGTDEWFFRATAANLSGGATYIGSLASDIAFAAVTPFSIESGDTFDTSDPTRIDFLMKMWTNSEDGFQVALGAGSLNTCFDLSSMPGSAQVYVGADKTVVTPPFKLETLGACINEGIVIDDVTVDEAAGNATFTVNVDGPPAGVVMVDYNTVDGTATAGSDYTADSGTLSIDTNLSSSETITIAITQDTESEGGSEDFQVLLSNPVNSLIVDGVGVGTITDDDISPCGAPSYAPGSERGIFIWKDCGGTDEWFFRATAANLSGGATYIGSLASDIAFAAVTPFSIESGDTFDTSDPTRIDFLMKMWTNSEDGFQVALGAGSLNTCFDLSSMPGSAQVYVGADKTIVTPPFKLETLGNCGLEGLLIDDVSVDEESGDAMFTVSLTGPALGGITVDYATVDGTATAGVDYTATSGQLSFVVNETSKTFTVPILSDTDSEPGGEQFSAELSGVVNSHIVDGTGVATIVDDDIDECGQPVYDPAAERGLFLWRDCGTGEWFMRVTAANGGEAVYQGSVHSDDAYDSVTPVAVEGADILDYTSDPARIDFTLTTSGATQDGVNFQLGGFASNTCFDITALPAGAQVFLGLGKYPVNPPFRLEDLGACVTQGITIDDVSVDEGAGNATFTVSLVGTPPTGIVTVDYATEDGSATAGSDYTADSNTLSIDTSQSTGATITIAITQDSDSEGGSEAFRVVLSSPVNSSIVDGVGVGTINDDDIDPCGAPSYDPGSELGLYLWQDCANGGWFLRATAANLPGGTTYQGLVLSDSSYNAVTPFSIEGEDTLDHVTDPARIDFTFHTDGVAQDGVDFALGTHATNTCFDLFSQPAGAQLFVGSGKYAVTPPLRLETLGACVVDGLSVDDVTVDEAAGNATFTVSLTGTPAGVVTVDYNTVDGSATAGSDYTQSNGQLSFAINETTKTIVVPIIQDTAGEGSNEFFQVLLSNPVNSLIVDGVGVGTITDDDISPCGAPSYAPGSERGIFIWKDCGGTDEWFFRATAANLSGGATYIGSLASDIAFAAVTPFSIESGDTFDTSDPTRIDFLMKMWTNSEDGFQVALGAGSLNTCFDLSSMPGSAQVYVGADKTIVTPPFKLETLGNCGLEGLLIDDVSVDEESGDAMFTVSLTGPALGGITVDYATVDGTATAGVDYTATSGQLSFVVNETSKTFTVPILSDTDSEPGGEQFSAELSGVVNSHIVDGTGVATIVDDDIDECGQPVYDPAAERGLFLWRDCGTGEWFMRVTAANGGEAVYQGSVHSDDAYDSVTPVAVEGADILDYTSDPARIDFTLTTSGATQDGVNFQLGGFASNTCFDITALPAGAQVFLGLGKYPVNPPFRLEDLGACVTQGITIDDVSVDEGAGNATFTVSLVDIPASTGIISVDYMTVDDSAVAGLDYTLTGGSLSFDTNQNETSKAVTVPINQDSTGEGASERFRLVLSNLVNSTVVDGVGLGTIVDDDVDPCGVPSYNPGSDRGLFVWKDCAANEWYFRATAANLSGGAFYPGSLVSDVNFASVTPFSIEGGDTFDTSDPKRIDFLMKSWTNTEDGFQVKLGAGSFDTCLDLTALPTGAQVFVGAAKTVLNPPFKLETLGPCGALAITVEHIMVDESSGVASFEVCLTQAASEPVTVNYATADGTAVAGQDYTAVSGQLTFAPNELCKTVAVPLVADGAGEGADVLKLFLTNGSVPIINNLALATINDFDYSHFGYEVVTGHGADPTGLVDSTAAIQNAIDTAYQNERVVFFPGGTYLVSDTLECMLPNDADTEVRVGHVLFGSKIGARPLIKLQDSAQPFQNTNNPRAVVQFWRQANNGNTALSAENGAQSYNQAFQNIDIDLGTGNPGAMGIRNQGAEGSAIQEVTIHAAGAFAGLSSFPASGGSVTDLEVYGGQYGIHATESRDGGPVLTGLKLTGQTNRSILYNWRYPLTVVGFEISKAQGPFIERKVSGDAGGHLALVDGTITLTNNNGNPAIKNTDRSIYLQNVYVQGAGEIVKNSSDGSALVSGSPGNWTWVEEYAYKGRPNKNSMLINGSTAISTLETSTDNASPPPTDLISRHTFPEGFCSFEDPTAVNVTDFGATGDGATDDTNAIQAALLAADKVLLPKGEYRLSATIDLTSNTRLCGIDDARSVLRALSSWTVWPPEPVVRTIDDPNAQIHLGQLQIGVLKTERGVYNLLWRAGRNSIAKDIWPQAQGPWPGNFDTPRQRVVITGGGGGRWYQPINTNGWDCQHPACRLILVENNTEPLTFYMLHHQYLKPDGGALTELRSARDVTVYGQKSETIIPGAEQQFFSHFNTAWPIVMSITSSENINIIGYEGLSQMQPGRGIFEVRDSDDVTLVNVGRRGTGSNAYYNESNWYLVKEDADDQFDTSDPKLIDYSLQSFGGAEDGFAFTTGVGAGNTCLDFTSLPVGAQVHVGAGQYVVTPPFKLENLNSCGQDGLTIDDISVDEGTEFAVFTVRLTGLPAAPVTVDYATVAGTATGADFTATSGQLVFDPEQGQTSKVILVPLTQDALVEGAHDFSVLLSNASNATIVDATGVATINDDDVDPCGAPSYNPGSERGIFLWQDCGTNQWFVRATAANLSGGATYVGSIVSDADFISVTPFSIEGSDTLDYTTDPAQIVFVMKMWTNSEDGFEFFAGTGAGDTCFDWSGVPSGAQVFVGAGKHVVEPPFKLETLGPCGADGIAIGDVTVDEGAQQATFSVHLGGQPGGTVSVDYATVAGTATEDLDYQATSGQLVFTAGQTSKLVTVPILQDTDNEGASETFSVLLSNASNAAILDDTGVATINDDDIDPCGIPNYDPITDLGVFLWQDCGTSTWFMFFTGGGNTHGASYDGTVQSDVNFSSVTPYSIETGNPGDVKTINATGFLSLFRRD